jgi:hypothetical protein
MKKIQLTIPEPCHENWEQMTKEEKGRYCGACKKTVIDFSGMSDRELATFFRKPVGDICGRVQDDQLNRDIILPRKRIPWLKYFFQFLIPAFLISAKSYAQGKIVAQSPRQKKPAENSFCIPLKDSKSNKKKDLRPIEPIAIKDSALKPGTEKMISTDLENSKFDQISITYLLSGTVGGLVVERSGDAQKERRQDSSKKVEKLTEIDEILVYPQPINQGSIYTVDLKKIRAGHYTWSVINGSGQLIETMKISIDKENQIIKAIAPFTTPGIYFVWLTNEETKKVYSKKNVIN